MREELRRIPRLSVCCRVMVRDRYGVWSAVTSDISARGCRIVTPRLLRPGTRLEITFSSDLFAEDLEAVGTAAWSTGDRLGVVFAEGAAHGSRSPAAWLNKVLEHGAMPDSATTLRVVPSVGRVTVAPATVTTLEPRLAPAGVPAAPVGASILRLPLRRA